MTSTVATYQIRLQGSSITTLPLACYLAPATVKGRQMAIRQAIAEFPAMRLHIMICEGVVALRGVANDDLR